MTKRERQGLVTMLWGMALGLVAAMTVGICAALIRDTIDGTHGFGPLLTAWVALGEGIGGAVLVKIAEYVGRPLAKAKTGA